VKNPGRFLFGCVLGLGIGYALTLMLKTGPPSQRKYERSNDRTP